MNRVTLTFAPNGTVDRICSDEPFELYWVCPHCPPDRVYRYQSIDYGSQHVDEEIGGHPVGHIDDDEFGELPPRGSKPDRRA
jgi:hypothetical protein